MKLDSEEVRAALVNPWRVCGQLGLLDGARRQYQDGALVRCPNHDDGTASCSVTRGPGGTLRVVCFGCGWKTDVFGLIAAVSQLDVKNDFIKVLREAAELADVEPKPIKSTKPAPTDRNYPPLGEVAQLWDMDTWPPWGLAKSYLQARHIDPGTAYDFELARALPSTGTLPGWAAHGGKSWRETGHLLVLPVYDRGGIMRSLRAVRVAGASLQKRLAPAGFKASGLVMADPGARKMLRATYAEPPVTLVVAEGEPDFMTWATRTSDSSEDAPAVIGVTSGAWTVDFAEAVPDGSTVILRTHHDRAGEKYAADAIKSLIDRCIVRRSS